MLSLWLTQMHHIDSNKGYRPTFTFLSKDFRPSDNRLLVLFSSYWSLPYYSDSVWSKKQWIPNLGHWFGLNLIILSFLFPKYAQWLFDHANFLYSGWQCKATGKGHSRIFANGCQPLKLKLRYRTLLFKNEKCSDLDFWHTASVLYLKHSM